MSRGSPVMPMSTPSWDCPLGRVIPNSGGSDFWGNPLAESAPPDKRGSRVNKSYRTMTLSGR